jgi:hypothetical protein
MPRLSALMTQPAAAVLMVIAFVADVHSADPRTEALVEGLRSHVVRVASLEYAAEVTVKRHFGVTKGNMTPLETPQEIFYRYDFVVSGPMFMMQMDMRISGAQKSKRSIQAYNGSRFQLFEQEVETLELNSQMPRSPYLAPQASLLPFMFVLAVGGSEPRIDMAALLEPARWSDLASSAVVAAPAEVNGEPCDVLQFDGTTGNERKSLSVSVSRSNGYPVKWTIAGPKSSSTTLVTRSLNVDTPTASVVVPVSIVATDYLEPQHAIRSVMEVSVEPSSVRANHTVPPERFTIDPSLAKLVVDADAGTTLDRRVAPARRGAGWRVGSVIVFILVLGFALWYSFRRRG